MRRRTFLQGCTALALMAGARLDRLALAAPGVGHPVLVVVSLRGGWDSLNAVVPQDGTPDHKAYLQARPTLAVRGTLDLNGAFGLHPALQALHGSWTSGQLAVVQAAGLGHDQRSHFEAIATMEAGGKARRSGWLGRYAAGLAQKDGYPAIAVGAPAMAWQGYSRTLTLESLSELDFQLPREDILLKLYAGDNALKRSGQEALLALQAARRLSRHQYRPKVGYPESEFAHCLREAARLIKLPELGARALTVELDGWDTHAYQAETMPTLLTDLAEGLAAFSEDVEGHSVTVVVLSEFGRRVAENGSGGTDHGHGSSMLVLGPAVKGGVYGTWPGLQKEQLYDLEDLAVSTDYRDVLGEILQQGMGCRSLPEIFPDHKVGPALGLFKTRTT